MNENDVSRELLLEFLDESLDNLNSTDGLFVQLEFNPDDMDIVNAIFRTVHSLKGNATFFGLMKTKKLSHSLENLLDSIRNGHKKADKDVIDTLLPGIDHLREMLNGVHENNNEMVDANKYNMILNRVKQVLSTHSNQPCTKEKTQINSYINELDKIMPEEGQETFSALKILLSNCLHNSQNNNDPLNTEIDSQNKLTGPALEMYSLLKNDSTKLENNELADSIRELFDTLHLQYKNSAGESIVEEIRDIFNTFTGADTGLDCMATELMLDQLNKLVTISKNEIETVLTTSQSNSENQFPENQKDKSKTKNEKTMRIPEHTLDEFMSCVGDLLGIEEMFRHLTMQLNNSHDVKKLISNMKEAVGQFEDVSKELRSKIIEIRQVEARKLLQKAPRIVRDIAKESGKEIELFLKGEDIGIDKSYMDLLDAPFTHIVRNAADHGIETVEKRKASGKPIHGTITIEIIEKEEVLQLVITDDGAGLDYDSLKNKALSLGLIGEDGNLTKRDITNLLFHSGVSTAKKVTDVSGRGVGMDVVKRAVEDVGGHIDVNSTTGQGSTFTLSLPRNASTQIIDGYIVRSDSGETYVLPLASVVEAFSVLSHEISDVVGKGKVVSRRGQIYPLISLDDIIGNSGNKHSDDINDNIMVVLLNLKGRQIALAIKEVIGIQKVVNKPVEGKLIDDSLFEGAAVSGTGGISLIINEEMLFREYDTAL